MYIQICLNILQVLDVLCIYMLVQYSCVIKLGFRFFPPPITFSLKLTNTLTIHFIIYRYQALHYILYKYYIKTRLSYASCTVYAITKIILLRSKYKSLLNKYIETQHNGAVQLPSNSRKPMYFIELGTMMQSEFVSRTQFKNYNLLEFF